MVSSSVRTMSFLSNQNVSTRKEVSFESKTDDFAKMMDNTINKTKDSNIDTNVESKPCKEDDVYKTTTKVEKVKEQENINEEPVVDEVEEVVPEEELTTEKIQDVSEEILSVVASVLNVTVEELQNALANLGIEANELLDVNNVMKLVMDMENIDNKMELLIHEDANTLIKNIQSSIEELIKNIKEETGIDIEQGNVLNQDVIGDVTDSTVVPDKQFGITEEVVEENADSIDDNATSVTTKPVVENIETNSQATGGETKSDLMNENDAKETSSDAMDNALNNPLNDLRDNVINEIENALSERVDEAVSTRIVREISENITLAIRQSTTSLEMQLYPEHLGKITVLLATEEGGITAKITAETEMAKNAIEQQLTILKENFDKQGLKVADIEVTIASHGFEQNLDKNDSKNEGQRSGRRGIRRDLLDEINGVSEDESEKENIVMQTLGNTVSYLA